VVRFVEFCPLGPEILGTLLGTSRPPGSFWSVGLAAAATAKTKEAVALCHGGGMGVVLFGCHWHCVWLVGETSCALLAPGYQQRTSP
jgi:hypothetical protein